MQATTPAKKRIESQIAGFAYDEIMQAIEKIELKYSDKLSEQGFTETEIDLVFKKVFDKVVNEL
jgi:hypothetical protein